MSRKINKLHSISKNYWKTGYSKGSGFGFSS